MSWSENYEQLNPYEKGEFKRLGNYLMSHTYMTRTVYDSSEEATLPNSDYSMVMRLFPVLKEYYEVTGWRLSKDDDLGVVSLISEYNNNRYSLDRITTLFLYVCRLIYEEKRENANSFRVVKTHTAEVIEKMNTLGLIKNGKTTQKERIDAQRALAHFNIIQKMTSAAWSGDGNDILILPSILYIISNQSINGMKAELDDMKLSEESTNEDA